MAEPVRGNRDPRRPPGLPRSRRPRRGRRRVRRQGAGLARATSSRRSQARTAPGSRRCCRSAGSASTRSPASFPQRDRGEYTLQVDGLVDTPLDARVRRARARCRRRRITRDFQCVTGWRVPDVQVEGRAARATLLDRAGVKPEATALRFTSFDGVYTESLTLEQARRDDVIVAYELEGEPLSTRARRAGAALRRADVRLQVVQVARGHRADATRCVPGYWEQLGYDVDGWVGKSNGRDDAPTSSVTATTPARGPALRPRRARRALVQRDAVPRRCSRPASALYVGPLSTLVGRRELVRDDPRLRRACCSRSRCSSAIVLRVRRGSCAPTSAGSTAGTRDDRAWWSRARRAQASSSASSTRARSSTRRSSARRSS